MSIDTDPLVEDFFDRSILIALDGDKVGALKADPETFGPVAQAIVAHYDPFLNPEDVRNGARMIRALTQLCFVYHRENILRQLREAILDLRRGNDFEVIIPVLLSSSGGGTGGALQILLAQSLQDASFFSRLTEGLPPTWLLTPFAFVVEPFAYAMRHLTPYADKVLANAYAFRMESALLEGQSAFKDIYHLGLASAHGTVLDSPEEIAKVLGTSVYLFERHWAQIKARLVNTHPGAEDRYAGRDVPEIVLRDFARPSANGHSSPPSAGIPANPPTP